MASLSAFAALLLSTAAACFASEARDRALVLLLASYVFYALLAPAAVPVLFFVTGTAYGGAIFLHTFTGRARLRVAWLAAAVVFLPLLLLKYLQPYFPGPVWLLPAGLSFYTLQAAGYLADVYRREHPPERSVIPFALFMSFFPQLLAGPIEKASRVLPMYGALPGWNSRRAEGALLLLLAGLFRKLLVAAALAAFVLPIFAEPAAHGGLALLLATVLARCLLYADFSGYTLLARGGGELFGVQLSENFRRPFAAASIGDFWRRWHISLYRWMKDYLFLSLVQSPLGRFGVYPSLVALFVAIGLWHQASWNFLLFGLVNGLLVAIGDAFRSPFRQVPRPLRVLFTFLVSVCLPFVLFQSTTLFEAALIYGKIFSFGPGWLSLAELGAPETWRLLAQCLVLMAALEGFDAWGARRPLRTRLLAWPLWARLPLTALAWIALLLLAASWSRPAGPFIYFRF